MSYRHWWVRGHFMMQWDKLLKGPTSWIRGVCTFTMVYGVTVCEWYVSNVIWSPLPPFIMEGESRGIFLLFVFDDLSRRSNKMSCLLSVTLTDRYERARVLGTRALQIAMCAPVMVELDSESDPLQVRMCSSAGEDVFLCRWGCVPLQVRMCPFAGEDVFLCRWGCVPLLFYICRWPAHPHHSLYESATPCRIKFLDRFLKTILFLHVI